MFLLIDKPKGITSHDVIDYIRKIVMEGSPSPRLRRIKVGHAGTLDPNATGLLIVGVGRDATKKLGSISKDTDKVYEAEVFLGEERDTDDVEGKIRDVRHEIRNEILRQAQDDKEGGKNVPSLSSVESVLKTFIGKQRQIPPAYSAIKLRGKKAYELARKGKEVKLEPRKVTIYSIKLIKYSYPMLRISCRVSSGTYIRALARDIGQRLDCGAYLKNLRRTKIGKYDIKDAVKLDLLDRSNYKRHLLPFHR